MAFETKILAIRWSGGKYEIVGTILAQLDNPEIERAGVLRDTSDPSSGYSDYAGLLTRREVVQFAASQAERASLECFLQEQPDAAFFLVHCYEWESGLND